MVKAPQRREEMFLSSWLASLFRVRVVPRTLKPSSDGGLSDGFAVYLDVLVGSLEGGAPGKVGDWGVEVVFVK